MTLMIADDTETYKGYTIKVHHSEAHESPRDWDNLGTMWFFNRNYHSPDTTPHSDPWESLVALYVELANANSKTHYAYQHLCNSFMNAQGVDQDIGNLAFEIRNDSERFFEKLSKYAIILPVYVYDHSGRSYSIKPFSCPWDSGQTGWTFVSLAAVRKEYNCKRITQEIREKVRKTLIAELETFNQWQSGEIYGFDVFEDVEDDPIDSCGGFYGMDAEKSGLLEAAKQSIDFEIKRKEKHGLKDIENKTAEPLELCLDLQANVSIAVNIPTESTWTPEQIKIAFESAFTTLLNECIDLDIPEGSANLTAEVTGVAPNTKLQVYDRENGLYEHIEIPKDFVN